MCAEIWSDLGYDIFQLIMSTLNDVTNTDVFYNDVHDFINQHKPTMTGPHLKNWQLLRLNENVVYILQKKQYLSTLKQ